MDRSIEPLQRLLNEYAHFKDTHQKERLIQDRAAFSGLLNGYAAVKALYSRLNRELASDFNLFRILNIEWYETRTHTPMLYHLLLPTGTHGQGLLFYELFLKVLEEESSKSLKAFRVSASDMLEVVQEKYTADGYIDIYIKGPNFAIVIENKVNAADQHRQLDRYYEYCKRALSLPPERILLVYLSRDGKGPEGYTLDKDNDEARNRLICISYRKHISSFLKQSIHACHSPKVKHTLEQYLQTVKQIGL